MTNFGQNILDWVVENAGPLAMAALVFGGLWMIIQRKLLQGVGLLVAGIFAFLLIYNPVGVKDFLLDIGNRIIGSGTVGLNPVAPRIVNFVNAGALFLRL